LNKGKRRRRAASRDTKFDERDQQLSALALPPLSGFNNLSALALSASALRRLGWSARIIAPALIPHPGEKQDLSAAVTGSRATGTVRGPEEDDIVHCGPR
jgi:hypothetical protein